MRLPICSSSSSSVRGLSGKNRPCFAMNSGKSPGCSSPRSRLPISSFRSPSMFLNAATSSDDIDRIPWAMLRKYEPITCSRTHCMSSSNFRCASLSTNR